ncbi:MAG: prolipoprotein diacylglyceryl transferase [Taibaiella sp.]|nr:prolipoprotein diacylglyceryl transferase [Taibaiella sp.]
MYPDFQYLLQSLTGRAMPEWLSIFKTFGFFVALAFIAAAWTSTIELKRKEKLGILRPTFRTIEMGKPVTSLELVLSALVGFILGYKIGGLFSNWAIVGPNPLGYVFSLQGNFLVGLAGALLLGISKYSEKKKQQLAEPVTKQVAVYPHQLMSEFVVVAAIGGLIGAKVFNAFETWDQFIKDPIGSLLSSSGLTFYGGLIVAASIFYYYARRHKIPFSQLCDSIAPGLMLAYGIGRFGCHFAGDGDWGIFNSAYITRPDTTLAVSTGKDYMSALHTGMGYFQSNFGSIGNVPSAHFLAPSWLPRWSVAMNYAHNVNNEGIPIVGCIGRYCSVLPVSVFPTSLYEALTCIGLFFVLWSLRGKLFRPYHMFGAYLILNGVERFIIEKIRVNYKYNWGFIHPTQAEIISTIFIIAGLSILLFYRKNSKQATVQLSDE